MKITKQRLREIIKEELNEASNPEWDSADKILRSLVYLAQDLEDSTSAEPAALASAIVSKLREAVDAMERRLNEKFAVMNEDADDDNDFEKDQATIDGDADGAAGVPPKPPHGFAERHYMQAYKHAFNRTAGERAKKSRQGLKRRASDLERKKQLRYKN
jgi:hypothetical protein